MPLRHIQEAERASVESVSASATRRIDDEAILDATRRLVLTHGISRTTLTDVAREAGLSRMTVYRRWSGLPELIGRMMQREWDQILQIDLTALADEASGRGNLRGVLVRVVVVSVIHHEPQLLMPYLLHRQGTMHRRAIGGITEGIRGGQTDGSITAGDPVRLATAVVMAVQGWVVSMDAAGAEQDRAQLDDELSAMLHAYLRPQPVSSADSVARA